MSKARESFLNGSFSTMLSKLGNLFAWYLRLRGRLAYRGSVVEIPFERVQMLN
jgi:hypothetical protein